jgi:CHASE3 domain sensor protein
LTRARGAFVLAVGFAVLLMSAVWLYHTVIDASQFQTGVRKALEASDRTFRLQLDEETSMRGFASTRDISLLVPYGQAQAQMDAAFYDLEAKLKSARLEQLLPLVSTEKTLNAAWHGGVAAPLLADPKRRDATARQERGKQLVDRFRTADQNLTTGINAAASAADVAVNTAVVRIIAVTAFFGVCFAAAFFYLSAQRARMLAETARQRLLYENEKRIADALQAAFVQKALPTIPNLGFHASYVPAGAEARVGGDWYDAFELPDGRILFSIGDVAGHGIEAAVTMSRARQAIISNALHEHDPAVVLQKANQSLMLQEPKMVTAVCGYIEPLSLLIRYATAGHPPPVLAYPDREPFFLEHDGIPLGILPSAAYGSFTAQARAGSLLVLYTDGVIEHKRDLADGERRLLAATRVAVAQGSSDPASSVRFAIFADKPPDDDAAIMTVSFAGDERTGAATVHAFARNRLSVGAGAD